MNTPTIVTITPDVITPELKAQADAIVEAGQAIATGHGTVGSAERRYASLMTSAFPGWHLITHDDKTNDGKIVQVAKTKLFEQLKAAKHTNPRTVWARVRKYAAEELGSAEGNEGEGEGEGEKAGDTKKREIRTRLREELAKLVKAISADDHPHEDLRACRDLLELAILKVTPVPVAVTTEAKAA
jgi:hypothetical protein